MLIGEVLCEVFATRFCWVLLGKWSEERSIILWSTLYVILLHRTDTSKWRISCQVEFIMKFHRSWMYKKGVHQEFDKKKVRIRKPRPGTNQ